jgi:hypothetical protein
MLPAPVAREVDRLARGAHRRTAWAHHPLCERYSGETLRLGRHVFCRGCALAAAGAVLGAVAGATLSPGPALASAACALLVAPALASLMWRLPKVASRGGPGAALGLALGAFAAAPGAGTLALAASLGALVLLHVRLYRRRGPDRSPCLDCPERTEAPRCAGFVPLLRRERAFQRAAGRMIDRTPLRSP